MESDDVAQGVTDLWSTIDDIDTLVPGGITYGRQTAGHGTGVYAVLDVKQGPTSPQDGWITGGKYIDFRHVTISLRGVKADCVTALRAVREFFDAEVEKGQQTDLDVPNTLATIQIRPILGTDDLTQDPQKKEGEDIWIGKAEYEVLTHRQR